MSPDPSAVADAIWWVGVAISFVLAGLGVEVARLSPEHRPVAFFFGATAAADVIARGIAVRVLNPARLLLHGAPFEDWTRLAFHVHQAATIVRPAGLALLAAIVLGMRRPPPSRILRAAVATLGLFIGGYPVIRGQTLGNLWGVVEVVAFLTAARCAWLWWRRSGRASLVTEGTVLLLVVVELGALIGWRDPFGARWLLAMVVYAVAYVALLALHLGELWMRSSSSQPRSSA